LIENKDVVISVENVLTLETCLGFQIDENSRALLHKTHRSTRYTQQRRQKLSMNVNFYWKILNIAEDTIDVMLQNKEKRELVAIKSM